MSNQFSRSKMEKLLREAGIQPTSQRLAIGHYVLFEAKHPSVEDVREWAANNLPKVSLATIYNTLNTLSECGLLKPLRFRGADRSYFDNDTSVHYHFLDETTGEIIDLYPHQIKLQMDLPEDLQVDDLEITLRGRKIQRENALNG
jgi:Fur family iron response transcriptional regulator